MTKVDFSDSEGGGALVEQGTYPCTVTGMEIKHAQTTGNPYYAFEFTIASGAFADRKLWLNNMIGAKDRNYYLRMTLEGITGEDVPLDADVEIVERDYIGRGCNVQVVHEERNGKVYATVAGIRPPNADQVIEGPTSTDDPFAPDGKPSEDYPW